VRHDALRGVLSDRSSGDATRPLFICRDVARGSANQVLSWNAGVERAAPKLERLLGKPLGQRSAVANDQPGVPDPAHVRVVATATRSGPIRRAPRYAQCLLRAGTHFVRSLLRAGRGGDWVGLRWRGSGCGSLRRFWEGRRRIGCRDWRWRCCAGCRSVRGGAGGCGRRRPG